MLETAIGTLEELQTIILTFRHHDGVIGVVKGNAPWVVKLAIRISSFAIAEHYLLIDLPLLVFLHLMSVDRE